jgi:hypothetical protein
MRRGDDAATAPPGTRSHFTLGSALTPRCRCKKIAHGLFAIARAQSESRAVAWQPLARIARCAAPGRARGGSWAARSK